ncbi:hypothetical protein ER308_08200 [Egibacter rhizosphaerae]|uniref:Helix-turn-helix domain-containing protein n=1 Tax=Egibacter rhizosphaerae TaxID=1670831 RepID=A0A411YE51_9ACTN|nr:hypothetical protein [Egibacter rhizosphaerae]QBI19533.1 hypothetical protein ER308_08200 [Egibacter rhizosphaerae]
MAAPELLHDDPAQAATELVAAHGDDTAWLDRFAEALDRQRGAQQLERVRSVWGLSQAETARVFGVSRQAVSKWLGRGVPSERAEAIADLAAASDLLTRYLQRDRIPAVVRRPAPALSDRSLLQIAAEGETGEVLRACREMFDVTGVHA